MWKSPACRECSPRFRALVSTASGSDSDSDSDSFGRRVAVGRGGSLPFIQLDLAL